MSRGTFARADRARSRSPRALTRAPIARRDLILCRTAKCHARARARLSSGEHDRLPSGEKILFFRVLFHRSL